MGSHDEVEVDSLGQAEAFMLGIAEAREFLARVEFGGLWFRVHIPCSLYQLSLSGKPPNVKSRRRLESASL